MSRFLTRALAAIGSVLLGTSLAVELVDAEPRLEMWLGVSASAAFLLATLTTRGDEASQLTARARHMIGAASSAVLAVLGLWEAAEQPSPRLLLLLVPVSLLLVTAVLAFREAGRIGQASRLAALRARLTGEDAERRHWVQELHDSTLQDLAAMEVALAAAVGQSDAQALAAGVTQVREMLAAQIASLRRLIGGMRPLTLDMLGLSAALDDLAARVSDAAGIQVTTDVDGLPRLPPDVEANMYRIVQEALTNAVRHSGAGTVAVAARLTGSTITISVRDAGGGGAPLRPGRGILGMRERAEALGAQLRITTGGDGTTVALRLDGSG